MSKRIYKKIIELSLKASRLARKIGIDNLFQPGLVKEMIIADQSGHEIISMKKGADAHAQGNPKTLYEYLSCKEGGAGQLDRMFKEPPEKRERSLSRVTRNDAIYMVIFYKNEELKIKTIYEVAPQVMLKEVERQLDRSSNPISHVSFPEKWAEQNGSVVYFEKAGQTK